MAKEEQIKSQIILEGEKEYRAACKGINTSLREIGSEMKLATAEFGDNAESIEALTRKQEILQKQLDEQAKKAKAAEDALKKMREGGIDPTDPAYQKMQTNLNNTRAEMVKVQREIDDTSKKLKSSKIDWESVGDTVGKVGKAIGAGVAAMGAAIGAAATAFLGLAESTREARENMGKLEAGFLQRRGIRRKMQRTLIPNCTAFLATTDRRPKPPHTLHSLRTTSRSLRRGRILRRAFMRPSATACRSKT